MLAESTSHISRCPYCGASTDHTTGLERNEDQVVNAGSIMVCWTCGQPSVIDEQMGRNQMVPEQIAAMRVTDAQLATILDFIAKRNAHKRG